MMFLTNLLETSAFLYQALLAKILYANHVDDSIDMSDTIDLIVEFIHMYDLIDTTHSDHDRHMVTVTIV